MFGLNKKKPSDAEVFTFQADAESVMSLYNAIYNLTDDVDILIQQRKNMAYNLDRAIAFQKKYPTTIKGKNTPQAAMEKIRKERKQAEKLFVERYVKATERKLLDYKTQRGKENHAKHVIDVFMFYQSEFLPETVKYFLKLMKGLKI